MSARLRLLLPLALVFALGSVWALWPSDPSSSLIERAEKAQPGPDQRPSDWALAQRLFPRTADDLDADALALLRTSFREALGQAAAMQAEARGGAFGAWVQDGPTDIGGRISDIEFAPSDPQRVYAAAGTGGVFRSDDAGLTWTPIFDDQALLNVGDLAVHPSDPDVVWVGTGEANGGHNNFAGGGLYRSDDGGATWTFLGLDATYSIGRIRIDPSDPDRVFVAALGAYFGKNEERGVYRTTDNGASWERTLFVSDSTAIIDLAMKPGDPNTLFATSWSRLRTPTNSDLSGPTSGVWRSTDGGDTWEELTEGLPNPNTEAVGRIGLAISESQPETIYALYTDGTFRTGLYRSDDGGDTWADYDGSSLGPGASFQWYFGQVRVRPDDPDAVFVLGVPLIRRTASGFWNEDYGGFDNEVLHVDHHAMAFKPDDPLYVLSGNDGGLDRSTDGGVTWEGIDGLPITQFYEIGLDAQNPERRYGGTQDNNTIRTASGDADDWDRLLGGDGFYVNIDPTDPDVIYAEYQFGNLFKSTDGGASFEFVAPSVGSEPTNWSTPVVMDPSDPQTLYYGSNRVYRTTNGANSWTPVSPRLTRTPELDRINTVTTIGVSPVDSDVVWAGTADGKVWLTTDGATWDDVTQDNLPFRWITRVIPDPVDADVAYLTFSGLKWYEPLPHVYRTGDAGQTWTPISDGLPDAPVNALAVDPADTNVLYLGSDLGAFVSLDRGTSWQALGTGMPAVSVYDLKIHPTERTLVAGTHGRSMFSLDISGVTTAGEAGSTPLDFALDAAFPNPFAASTTLRYRLNAPSDVRVEVFDVSGRRIAVLADEQQAAGEHRVTWEPTDLASGTYVVRLRAGDRQASQRVTLAR